MSQGMPCHPPAFPCPPGPPASPAFLLVEAATALLLTEYIRSFTQVGFKHCSLGEDFPEKCNGSSCRLGEQISSPGAELEGTNPFPMGEWTVWLGVTPKPWQDLQLSSPN